MDLYIKTTGAGTFSKFTIALQRAISQIDDLDEIDTVYIGMWWDAADRTRTVYIDGNPFDFALLQTPPPPGYRVVEAGPCAAYTDLFNHKDLPKLRKLASKIKFQPHLLERVGTSIGSDVLGVHVRLTDMNQYHGKEHGIVKLNDYISTINEALAADSTIKKIFVASDNVQSLNTLKSKYGDMLLYHENLTNRCAVAHPTDSRYNQFLRNNSSDRTLWEDSFLEMLTLARCGQLIYRISNLSNAAIMFSDNIRQTRLIKKI